MRMSSQCRTFTCSHAAQETGKVMVVMVVLFLRVPSDCLQKSRFFSEWCKRVKEEQQRRSRFSGGVEKRRKVGKYKDVRSSLRDGSLATKSNGAVDVQFIVKCCRVVLPGSQV